MGVAISRLSGQQKLCELQLEVIASICFISRAACDQSQTSYNRAGFHWQLNLGSQISKYDSDRNPSISLSPVPIK